MLSNAALYRRMVLIRIFEEKVLDAFSQGVFSGTTHTYLGQEANAVGILAHLKHGDAIYSNHRCHGHYLAYRMEPRMLFEEMMGKPGGMCAGRGGSQHIHDGFFQSNGVQGSSVPLGTGYAFGSRLQGENSIAVVFIGDGTLGEGILYESLNMASLWDVPVLYVVENNQIAQTTPFEQGVAGSITARFEAFGIHAEELDSSDVIEITGLAGRMIARVRASNRPEALVLHTHRFGPHSKGDDTREEGAVVRLKVTRDPISIMRGVLKHTAYEKIDREADGVIEKAYQAALDAPSYDEQIELGLPEPTIKPAFDTSEAKSVMESLNLGLNQAMSASDKVYLMGEDILDPYGGAFKITKGLSDKYPDRVISTPISEAGFVGVAGGMAASGLRPVVEIMFGDFLTLAADQIINNLSKFNWMYAGQANFPVVIRTPMGGRRGYGPTHSQTIEKHFMGVPGLRVLAPTTFGDPGALLGLAIEDNNLVLFIENKLQYLRKLWKNNKELTVMRKTLPKAYAPLYTVEIAGSPEPAATIVAYGYMADLAGDAMLKLAFDEEIFIRLIVPTQLSPSDVNLPIIKQSVLETSNLLVLEEGTKESGWGSEVLAQVMETLDNKAIRARRLTAENYSIPASTDLEKLVLPQPDQIVDAIKKIL